MAACLCSLFDQVHATGQTTQSGSPVRTLPMRCRAQLSLPAPLVCSELALFAGGA